jgi:hypothetical protein
MRLECTAIGQPLALAADAVAADCPVCGAHLPAFGRRTVAPDGTVTAKIPLHDDVRPA